MLQEKDGDDSYMGELIEQVKEPVGDKQEVVMAIAALVSRRRGEFHGGLRYFLQNDMAIDRPETI